MTHSKVIGAFKFLKNEMFQIEHMEKDKIDSLPDSSRKSTTALYSLLAEAVGRRKAESRPHPWS